MTVTHLSAEECREYRDAALARLGMTLEEARAQWADCSCCLIHSNWAAFVDLETVKDMDYLLGDKK